MKRIISILAFAIFLSFLNTQANQNHDFDVTRLSEEGRKAYEELLEATAFRIGGVGYSGSLSHETIALRDILDEKDAVVALRNLINYGSPEGSLYGLLGLRIKNLEAFKQELERYKSRPELPARKVPFTEREKIPLAQGQVFIQDSCVWMPEDLRKILSKIESGEYDRFFK